MRAVRFEQYGGPEVLEIAEVDEPHAGPGRIRIRVHAAGVNAMDWKLREGAMAKGPLTHVEQFGPVQVLAVAFEDVSRMKGEVLAELIARLIEVSGERKGVAGVAEALVERKDNGLHAIRTPYQGTLLVVLRGPEFSSRVWRTRVTEPVRLLRFSSRCARTVSAYSSAL